MGNDSSKRDHSRLGSEMVRSTEIYQGTAYRYNSTDLEELKKDTLKLKLSLRNFIEIVDDILNFDEDEDESDQHLETRLLFKVKHNQTLIHTITRDLERQSKIFDSQKNEVLIILVKEVVSIVNSYTNSLLMAIKRYKRQALDSEGRCSYEYLRSGVHAEPHFIKVTDLVYDIISEHQDVDAMLLQLMSTETERQELERGVVMMLVYGRQNLR
uniref:Uncharacterized protein n=1 Tax=Biomphalaria glabrata TaxID=6526 RepID=A0A2C9M365_BIOGL